jgi:hypothetical protein
VRQDPGGDHPAQGFGQRGIELLQQIDQASSQMTAATVEHGGHRLRDHGDRHAEREQHDGQTDQDVY